MYSPLAAQPSMRRKKKRERRNCLFSADPLWNWIAFSVSLSDMKLFNLRNVCFQPSKWLHTRVVFFACVKVSIAKASVMNNYAQEIKGVNCMFLSVNCMFIINSALTLLEWISYVCAKPMLSQSVNQLLLNF